MGCCRPKALGVSLATNVQWEPLSPGRLPQNHPLPPGPAGTTATMAGCSPAPRTTRASRVCPASKRVLWCVSKRATTQAAWAACAAYRAAAQCAHPCYSAAPPPAELQGNGSPVQEQRRLLHHQVRSLPESVCGADRVHHPGQHVHPERRLLHRPVLQRAVLPPERHRGAVLGVTAAS
jgi:hypothetical protein